MLHLGAIYNGAAAERLLVHVRKKWFRFLQGIDRISEIFIEGQKPAIAAMHGPHSLVRFGY